MNNNRKEQILNPLHNRFKHAREVFKTLKFPKTNMASVTYLGHSSFKAQLGKSTIYLDPWFNQKPREAQRLVPSAVENVDSIRKADAIFITSEGFDHCDPYDVTRIAQRTFCPVIAPEETLARLPDVNQRQKVTASLGDDFSINCLDVQVTQAKYYRSVNPVGYVIRSESQSIYFAGATYNFFEMSKITCEVAILPISGDGAMDVLSALTAVKSIRAKYAVPMMFNTFQKTQADSLDFARKVKENNSKTEVKILQVGETMQF